MDKLECPWDLDLSTLKQALSTLCFPNLIPRLEFRGPRFKPHLPIPKADIRAGAAVGQVTFMP